MAEEREHADLAAALRERAENAGAVDPAMRRELLSGRPDDIDRLPEPYRTLARNVADASYRVTDEQVAAVRAATGSDKAAFEVVMSASVGAGLRRWDAAARAIEDASR
jgi:hypothetical protein